MSSTKDFVIKDGVLVKYKGAGGDVVIPEGVTEIGRYAFDWPYNNIKSVVIPEGVTVIGERAFSCSSLRKITAPKSLQRIGSKAFYDTPFLKKQKGFVIVNSVLVAYFGEDEKISIPDGITSISDGAFSRTHITDVVLPQTIVHIGAYAFSHCESLVNINIPPQVEDIEKLAFNETPWLAKNKDKFIIMNGILYRYQGNAPHVTIPDTVHTIGALAFMGKTRLETVDMPESVTRICDSAFFECKRLSAVSLSKNTKTIGNDAFGWCTKLKNISSVDCVESFGDSVFHECNSLRDDTGRIIIDGILFQYSVCGNAIEIPDNVSCVRPDAIENAEDVERVSVSAELFEDVWNQIGSKNKFTVAVNCIKDGFLTDAIIAYVKKNRDKILPLFIEQDDMESIMRVMSASGKMSLEKVDKCIELSRESVQSLAFFLNYKSEHFDADYASQQNEDRMNKELGITERTAKDWREIFRFSVREGCVHISGYKKSDSIVQIPEFIDNYAVTVIGDSAFKGNEFIEQVILPDGIITIGDYAFKGCTALKSINIPKTVKEIFYAAFEGCKSLISIEVPETACLVAGKAFKDCTSLKSVRLPRQLEAIYVNMFCNCTSMEQVNIPDNITAVYSEAFKNCKLLESVNLPSSVTHIADNAFAGCRSLKVVKLADGIKQIEFNAFKNCTRLTEIHIPATVKVIKSSAFEGCKKLTIYGMPGTRAANFAKAEKIPFVAE